MNNGPIGMFDSGVGGLTVVKEAFKILPNEEIVYFADTARNPYGLKTDEEIINYSREIADFLISQGAKLIVIACNTATIASIDILKKEYNIPIIGVVEPAAEDVVSKKSARKVGLIATDFTVNSKKYEEIIKSKNKDLEVFGKGCPELVVLAEKGIFNNEESNIVVKKCLKDLLEEGIDTLVLGCTHFPLHLNDIKNNIPSNVRIVDPAVKTVETVFNILREKNMLREDSNKPKHKFTTSGDKESFTKAYDIILKQ